MQITRHITKSCCGGTSLIFKTDRPLAKSDIEALVKLGFVESPLFTKAGILHLHNSVLTVSGPLGSDRLQIMCRVSDCQEKLNSFEVLLQQLG